MQEEFGEFEEREDEEIDQEACREEVENLLSDYEVGLITKQELIEKLTELADQGCEAAEEALDEIESEEEGGYDLEEGEYEDIEADLE